MKKHKELVGSNLRNEKKKLLQKNTIRWLLFMIMGTIIKEQTLKRNSELWCGTFEVFFELGKKIQHDLLLTLEIPHASTQPSALCMKCSQKVSIRIKKQHFLTWKVYHMMKAWLLHVADSKPESSTWTYNSIENNRWCLCPANPFSGLKLFSPHWKRK